MRRTRRNLPYSDHYRLAAVLVYARGSEAAAYAADRRAEALASSDAFAAEYWTHVQEVILELLPAPATLPSELH